MRTRKTALLFSVASLTLGLLQPGCVAETMDVPSDEHDPEAALADEAPARDSLLALTAISAGEAPVLGHLAGEMRIVPARTLLGRSGEPGSDPAEILARATAIVADMGQLDARAIAEYAPLLEVARTVGVPMVLENVRDPALMAAMIGYGVPAEAALIEPSRQGQTFRITLLGDVGERAIKAHSDTQRVEAGADRAFPEGRSDKSHSEPPSAIDRPSPEEIAERVAGRLRDVAAGAPTTPMGLTMQSYPLGTYKEFYIQLGSAYVWDPGGHDQNATIDVGLRVQLVAASQPAGKYMIVSGMGGGNPGQLTWNNSEDRGYFQESLTVGVQPSGASLTSYDREPATANATGSYTETNGCTFGGGLSSSGEATTELSCSTSASATVSLSDFTVDNLSAGQLSKWRFRMSSAGGHPYSSWQDLFDDFWGGLYSLPALAKSTLDPKFEAIYRADQTFSGTVDVATTVDQVLRDTWTDCYFFACDIHSKSYTTTLTLQGVADFGAVSTTDVYVPLVIKSNDLAMDVDQASTSWGASMIQWPYLGGANQQFQIMKAPENDGSYLIKPRHTGFCLDIEGGSTAAGAKAVQWPCNGGANQRFEIVGTAGGTGFSGSSYYYLKPKHASGMCLQPWGGSATAGTAIHQFPCTGADAQLFRMSP